MSKHGNKHMNADLIGKGAPVDPRLVGNAPPPPVEVAPPIDPPPSLKGTYLRCGGCNGWIPDQCSDRCPRCAPASPALRARLGRAECDDGSSADAHDVKH